MKKDNVTNDFPDFPFTPIDQMLHLIEKNGQAIAEEPIQDLSDDEELRNDPEYQIVIKNINNLWENGVIRRGSGYCLSMSDLIHSVLLVNGIKSRVVECKLTVLGIDPPGFCLVGHNGLMHRLGGIFDPNNYDTHVICITETKIPMLIDLSINHIRKEVQFICERANGHMHTLPGKSKLIGHYDFKQSLWTYEEKDTFRLPALHQKSIIDRIKTDSQVKKAIYWLFALNIIGILLTLTNLIRGLIDYSRTYL